MVETADAVIVGAGFAGAATAYHLTRRGFQRVLLLEREAVPGYHASGRNAALAVQLLEDRGHAQLAVEGTRFIHEPPDGFAAHPLLRRCGSLMIATGRGGHTFAAKDRLAQEIGVGGKRVPTGEAVKRVPLLAEVPPAEAFWTPTHGIVDIRALLQGYLAAARRDGTRVRYREPVVGIETDRGRIAGVRTPTAVVATPVVVNAAGAWAAEIGRLAGVGRRTLTPRRRHLFQPRVAVPIQPDWPMVWDVGIDVYFRPEGNGLLMSPCDASIHAAKEPDVDPAVSELLMGKLERAFPRLSTAAVVSCWACLRTFTPDERFLIGRDPEMEGLVWVAGLGGHGMTTSAAVGRLAAQAVLGEESSEVAAFTPARLGAATS